MFISPYSDSKFESSKLRSSDTVSLVERTHMFQNLMKYLKGPSAMILRMFSTMYTRGKTGNMVLGLGVINSPQKWVCAQEYASMCTVICIIRQLW